MDHKHNSYDKTKVNNAVLDKDVVFYFIPSEFLRAIAFQKNHPLLQGISDGMIANIIAGSGIMLTNDMVLKYIDNKLDEKNTFILDNGEIRVLYEGNLRIKKNV